MPRAASPIAIKIRPRTGVPDLLRRAVFLDRDGVLNRAVVRDGKPYPPTDLKSFEILPEVGPALAALKSAGFLLIVATNQPDVARGVQTLSTVESMHDILRQSLPLDGICACYEEDGPDCTCYKPKPGLLLDAASKLNVNLRASYMVGDRWRDVGAGVAAGCTTIFIDRHYAEDLRDTPDISCGNLAEAAAAILKDMKAPIRGAPRIPRKT